MTGRMTEETVMLSARISAAGFAKLDQLAEAWRMKRSAVVREALRFALSREADLKKAVEQRVGRKLG